MLRCKNSAVVFIGFDTNFHVSSEHESSFNPYKKYIKLKQAKKWRGDQDSNRRAGNKIKDFAEAGTQQERNDGKILCLRSENLCSGVMGQYEEWLILWSLAKTLNCEKIGIVKT